MAKRLIDWYAVAQAFNSGEQPVKEIAEKHGLAAITIYAKANREGWARPAPLKPVDDKVPLRKRVTRAKKSSRDGGINAARALGRMMVIINRLADELEQHLDGPGDSATSAVEKKGAADILTSLARALEKLTALEREARQKDTGSDQTVNVAGANDGWEEIQRRLARLSAALPEA